MFFDQFDKDTMRVIMDAQTEARALGSPTVGTEHLLLSATTQKRDAMQAALARGGLAEAPLRELLQVQSGKTGALPALDRLFASTAKDELLPFAKDTERAFRKAAAKAQEEVELVSVRDLLREVLADEAADCAARAAIGELGIDAAALAGEVEKGDFELVGGGGAGKGKNTTLSECSTDLTQRARDGLLDPLIGRSDEVKRCMQILVRRRKPNPVLLGDPGVGKTAIAEGLAQAIADGNVPKRLQGKKLLALELGMLVADTKYRGEFEERLKSVIEEVTASNETILFIDEIHTLVGAGAAEGAIDAANLLKPALARGELQCIGATTLAEYRRYIEKDAALERRFQPVDVPEPTVDEATDILRGLAPRYAEHHDVAYDDDALVAAAKLAQRYISDRFLPDKAIDLIDEAGAYAQIAGFDAQAGADAPPPTVDSEAVAEVVSAWTGIPLKQLSADDAKDLRELEGTLGRRVIGQLGAVGSISRALRRARVGLRSPRRPVASLIFCGPTGVGKTELAKAVAETYYGAESAMVRFDMSEYMEAHSVSRLTGPPPGYVGYEAGGQLTEAVRRTPHCVILMDEVEKAHADVFNVLLQLLDDGRLTDNKGRTVDFTNAVLILTSNVGSRAIVAAAPDADAAAADADAAYARMRGAVRDELGGRFRPELLNRLDEIVVFETLKRDEVESVAALMLAEVAERCAEAEVALEIDGGVRALVAAEGFSPKFGARPLRRAVQRLCEDAVAEALLDGFAAPGEALQLGTDGARLTLRNARGDTRTPTPPAAQGIEDDPLEKVESGGVIDASAYSELDVALRSSPAARV